MTIHTHGTIPTARASENQKLKITNRDIFTAVGIIILGFFMVWGLFYGILNGYGRPAGCPRENMQECVVTDYLLSPTLCLERTCNCVNGRCELCEVRCWNHDIVLNGTKTVTVASGVYTTTNLSDFVVGSELFCSSRGDYMQVWQKSHDCFTFSPARSATFMTIATPFVLLFMRVGLGI